MNIQELLNRYNLSSRKSLYNRLNALKIELSKDSNNKSYATDEQLKLLDELENHLKAGGVLRNFQPVISATVELSLHDEDDEMILPPQWEKFTAFEKMLFAVFDQLPKRFTEVAQEIGTAIASNLKPFAKEEALLWYSENKILISTSQARDLIGISPKGAEFVRGSFRFVRSGKVGNQNSWLVEKILINS